MKITEDFIGNETKALTKTKIASILRWWGFNPDSYSTWGNARVDMNNILSGTPTGEISDRERASTFLSKINYVNDTDAIIGDTIFAAGVPGVWYDPSDLSTLFQDTAGTIPVTGVEQPVGRILDKSGRGNHASQATTTARPILSARYNLLTNTEDCTKSWVITANVGGENVVGPNGRSAIRIFKTNSSANANARQAIGKSIADVTYSYQISIYAGTSDRVSVGIGATSDGSGAWGGSNTSYQKISGPGSASISSGLVAVSNLSSTEPTVIRVERRYISSVATAVYVYPGTSNSSQEGDSVIVQDVDCRYAFDRYGRPDYQRVGDTASNPADYDIGGFSPYLRFDGVDDHLNIGVLNMSAASAAGYFSAITKLSDASSGRWYSHGLTTSTGSVRLLAPASAGQASVWAGFVSSSGLREVGGTAHAAPITLTVKSEIEPSVRMWITHNNGTWIQTTVDPTVFSAGGEACIGAQVFASTRANFFNGRIYALLVAGRKSSGSEQAVIETFLRNKSRAY